MRGCCLPILLLLAFALALSLRVSREGFRSPDMFVLVLARMDADHDGRVSRDEYVRYGRLIDFERYDTDHDGCLDVREYRHAFLTQEPDPGEVDPALRLNNASPQRGP